MQRSAYRQEPIVNCRSQPIVIFRNRPFSFPRYAWERVALNGLDALQVFARVQVGDREVVFGNLVANGPLAFIPEHFADDAGPRFVAHAIAEDLDPIADVETFVRDFLPQGGSRAEGDIPVAEATELVIGAVAAEHACARDHCAGERDIVRMKPVVAVLRPAEETAVFRVVFEGRRRQDVLIKGDMSAWGNATE